VKVLHLEKDDKVEDEMDCSIIEVDDDINAKKYWEDESRFL
jgi:hypothetical protein